jgi:hypothetical protein
MDIKLKPKPLRAIASEVFPPVTGTGAVNEASAIDAVKNKEIIATASTDAETVPPNLTPPDQIVSMSATQLQELLQTALASAKETVTNDVKQETERDRQALQAELNQTKNDLATAQGQATAITNVLATLGHTHPVTDKSSSLGIPAYNKMIESGNDKIVGRVREWRDRIDSAHSQNVQSKLTGRVYKQTDWRSSDRYLVDNRAALRDEVESYCRANGFFKGLLTDTAAATVRTDLLPTLLDFLSAIMRTTQSAKFVFWQLAYKDIKFGAGTGDTVQVSRVRDLTAPTSVSDTLLPITGPNGTSQNLSINSVSGVLTRRGLNEPVQIPQFFSVYSLLDLETLVGNKLGKHQQADVDLRIRTRFLATTRILYNDGGAVTTTPADVGTGNDGTLTESFLNAVHAYITGTFLVDADDSGSCWLVAPSRALVGLKNSLTIRNRVIDKLSLAELTALFTFATNSDVPTISGYVGTYCGFHIFESSAYGNGAAATEGVQNTTLGVGSTLTRTCLCGGWAAVARAVGMEPEIRRATEDNFQTTDKWTWISDEVVFDLDNDSAIAAEQQTRVFQLRVTDTSV